MSDHRRFLVLAASAIDFGLDLTEQRDLDGHLADCPDCRRDSHRLRSQAIRLRDRPRAVPTVEMWARVAMTWAPRDERQSVDAALRLVLLVVAVLLALMGLAVMGAGALAPDLTTLRSVATDGTARPSSGPRASLPMIGTTSGIGVPSGASAASRSCGAIAESGCATDVIAAFGSIWTTTIDSIARVDPERGEVLAYIPVGDYPLRLAEADGSVWVTVGGSGALVRIDPTTNRVADTVEIGRFPAGVATGEGSLWVAEGDSKVIVRVDPVTVTVQDRIKLDVAPWDVAVTQAGVWVTDRYAATLLRIDPATGATEVAGKIPRAVSETAWDYGAGLTVDGERIWIASTGAQASSYDPVARSFTSVVMPYFGHLAARPDGLWLVGGHNRVLQRLDPRTMRPIGQQSIPLFSASSGGDWELSVAVTDAAIWIRSYDDEQLLRVARDGP